MWADPACDPEHLEWIPRVPWTGEPVEVLAQRSRVVFAGDSLMKVQFDAVQCLAEASARRLPHVTYVETHFLTRVVHRRLALGALDDALLAAVHGEGDTIVVVGVGAWYSPFKLMEEGLISTDLSPRRAIAATNLLFEEGLSAGLDALRKIDGVRVIVRSLAPGHASCKSHKEEKGHLRKYDYPGMHRRNLILKRIARRMSLPFLDVWTPSINRPDSHPASHFSGASSIAHDCLHHCFSPWSVLPTWNNLLAHLLTLLSREEKHK